ncbi:RAMP superfamily CRISPR-associated protein [Rhodovulum sulfidophilum]|uniref:RAMP superfamily CRISPR-associated protein n=1 Tax=Rhodovulum sulfidophilum TaxID=35806 RepID=UPI0009522E26|nr:RAMP superfamily CRISPR-associated protein [Rhodovulum sulfidophilum]MBL3553150.1 hypothetical protein [Rhodovulum sulfidophilum]OLS50204.1 hypothetical protein BV379_19225 [Rhodovulum sulfidophilum]
MTVILKLRILSYWRAGTGRNRPGALDALCQRDHDGLPMIPGKHLKGLLRDAVRWAHGVGWTPSLDETTLFGGLDAQADDGLNGTRGGCIRVDSALLPDAERAVLRENPDLIALLFDTRRSTAIGPNGTAEPGSLRFEEVAVPMTLEARLCAVGAVPDGWESELEKALTLVRAVGAQRTRGLGRCILTLEKRGAA